MSYLCAILYESVVGYKRTSEYFLETERQNDLNNLDFYKHLLIKSLGFLKKYCVLAEFWLRENVTFLYWYIEILTSYKQLWNTQENFGFLKKYCILAELWAKNWEKNAFQRHFYMEVSVFKTAFRVFLVN